VRSWEREKFISARMSKYVEFLKQGIEQSITYAMKMSPYVDYWEDILLHLTKPLLIQGCILLEGFWPSNNWKLNYARVKLLSIMSVVDLEDLVICPYCGPINMKPILAYTLFRNFNNGDFVFVRPHDLFLVLVWLGRT
jgi:hypothetical protein